MDPHPEVGEEIDLARAGIDHGREQRPMSGKKAREARRVTREEMGRFLWDSSPLAPGAKVAYMAEAQYMLARFMGEEVSPPPRWTPEQVRRFEGVLADRGARKAMLAWAMKGAHELYTETAAAQHGNK